MRKALLGSCRRPGHGNLPPAGLVHAWEGACPGRWGSGRLGVGVKGHAREPVRGMCFRLAKLEVRQSVAFRDEKRVRLTWGPPER